LTFVGEKFTDIHRHTKSLSDDYQRVGNMSNFADRHAEEAKLLDFVLEQDQLASKSWFESELQEIGLVVNSRFKSFGCPSCSRRVVEMVKEVKHGRPGLVASLFDYDEEKSRLSLKQNYCTGAMVGKLLRRYNSPCEFTSCNKFKRCDLHRISRGQDRVPSRDWSAILRSLPLDEKVKLCQFDAKFLSKLFSTYLARNVFCADCKANANEAFNLLVDFNSFTKLAATFDSTVYDGLAVEETPNGDVVVVCEHHLAALVNDAEQALENDQLSRARGEKVDRHATTVAIGQEQVLLFLGETIREQLNSCWIERQTKLRAENLFVWCIFQSMRNKIVDAQQQYEGFDDRIFKSNNAPGKLLKKRKKKKIAKNKGTSISTAKNISHVKEMKAQGQKCEFVGKKKVAKNIVALISTAKENINHAKETKTTDQKCDGVDTTLYVEIESESKTHCAHDEHPSQTVKNDAGKESKTNTESIPSSDSSSDSSLGTPSNWQEDAELRLLSVLYSQIHAASFRECRFGQIRERSQNEPIDDSPLTEHEIKCFLCSHETVDIQARRDELRERVSRYCEHPGTR